MVLKKSEYNILWEDDGNYFGYNSFRNSFIVFDNNKEYLKVKALLNTTPIYSDINNTLLKTLTNNGFLIDSKFDEFNFIKLRYEENRYSKKTLTLTISPTLDCNFNCSYCFEDNKREIMTKEVIDRIKKYVEKKLLYSGVFGVVWFGGEPTLELEIIEKLSKYFIKISNERRAVYSSMMITNGYDLNTEKIKLLKLLKIDALQITVDGSRDIHNIRRPYKKDNKGTFDKIIENIKIASKYFKISVRINIDKENFFDIKNLFDILEKEGLKNRVYPYLGHVQDFAKNELDKNHYKTRELSKKEFSIEEIKIFKYALKKGFKISIYPRNKNDFCGATRTNSVVFGPNGEMHKCWNDSTNPKASFGKITDRSYFDSKNYNKWILWNPFDNINCKNCSYLPLCLGGCPYTKIQNNKKNNCEKWKFSLKTLLKMHYDNKTIFSCNVSEVYQ